MVDPFAALAPDNIYRAYAVGAIYHLPGELFHDVLLGKV